MSNATPKVVNKTLYIIIFAISFAHLLNDLIQVTFTSLYPMIKESFQLSFTQIGIIHLVFQLKASILQPFVGNYTDKNPLPYSLPVGMLSSGLGLIILSFANSYALILVSVCLLGIGSAVFHPEASRVAQLASGGKKGLAQSIFQVGGNAGSSLGPLIAAWIIVPYGQRNILWTLVIIFIGIVLLTKISGWYKNNIIVRTKSSSASTNLYAPGFTKKKVYNALTVLLVLIFSKYFYMASMSSYFTFFMIEKFGVSVEQSQIYLFVFLFAIAAGTIIGGPLGDKYGRKKIIWVSILGAAPFTLVMPYVGLTMTVVLSAIIGLIIASAFSAILVYATDLMPGKVGMIAGLFFGFAFGMAGLASAILGALADYTNIEFVFKVCAFLPILGIVTALLPDIRHQSTQ